MEGRIVRVIFGFLLAIQAAIRCESLTCHCEIAKCPPINKEACPRGITQDICGCCSVCAGDVGEDCGGPWGLFGDCGEELECHQEAPCPPETNDSDCYLFYLTEPGKCVEVKKRSILNLLGGSAERSLPEIRRRQTLRLLKHLQDLKKK